MQTREDQTEEKTERKIGGPGLGGCEEEVGPEFVEWILSSLHSLVRATDFMNVGLTGNKEHHVQLGVRYLSRL